MTISTPSEFTASYWNEYIYTYQPTIIEELAKRRADTTLKAKVEAFWGDFFPSFLKDVTEQLAFFSRPIITPNMETRFFVDILPDFKLQPLFMEFPDKFASINESKYYTAKIHSFGQTKKGKPIVHKESLISFNDWEGKPMTDVQTIEGGALHQYHHDLFKQAFPEYRESIVDITNWFNTIRHDFSEYYYLGYLALGIYHGALFENFLLDDEKEIGFFIEKVIPSFREIERIFGMKPLISPVLPLTTAKLNEWYYYPPKEARQLF